MSVSFYFLLLSGVEHEILPEPGERRELYEHACLIAAALVALYGAGGGYVEKK